MSTIYDFLGAMVPTPLIPVTVHYDDPAPGTSGDSHGFIIGWQPVAEDYGDYCQGEFVPVIAFTGHSRFGTTARAEPDVPMTIHGEALGFDRGRDV